MVTTIFVECSNTAKAQKAFCFQMQIIKELWPKPVPFIILHCIIFINKSFCYVLTVTLQLVVVCIVTGFEDMRDTLIWFNIICFIVARDVGNILAEKRAWNFPSVFQFWRVSFYTYCVFNCVVLTVTIQLVVVCIVTCFEDMRATLFWFFCFIITPDEGKIVAEKRAWNF